MNPENHYLQTDLGTMYETRLGKALVYFLVVTTTLLGAPRLSLAAPISTRTLLQLEERQTRIEHIDRALSRAQVREALIGLGVAPGEVKARVAALSDEELAMLEKHLDKLPAGGQGILVIAGIAFIVLIILDLVGVTNVFTGVT